MAIREEELALILHKHGYEMREMIGKGGFGRCYVVYSPKYGQVFVCKIQDAYGRNDNVIATLMGSYEKELSALQGAYHPHVLKIYDSFVEDNAFFIIEEFCQNGSLDQAIPPTGIENAEKLEDYARQLVDAFAHLHSIGIVHHDIKPANVFIDEYGRARLGDFGLARMYKNGAKSNTYQGSLPYAPPELLMYRPYDPFKADVWSFGVMLYQLSTGRMPFRGFDHTELKQSILSGFFDQPKGVSVALNKLILRCLKYDPAERISFPEMRPYLPKLVRLQLSTKSVPTSLLLTKSFYGKNNNNGQQMVRLHSKGNLLPPLHPEFRRYHFGRHV